MAVRPVILLGALKKQWVLGLLLKKLVCVL